MKDCNKIRSKANVLLKQKSKKKPERLVQTHLLFGNSLKSTCKDCGMSYQISSSLDSTIHKKFHKSSFEGYDWPGNYGRRVFDVSSSNDYIVKVDSTSKPTEKRLVEELMTFVNTELSAPEENDSWKNEHEKGAAFVYIRDKRAIGVVVVERVNIGSWMIVHSGELLSNDQQKLVMGISRIYTARKYRRQKIATTLLEVARTQFVYGLIVDKSLVGWSQPSTTGGKVASKWAGRVIEENKENTNLELRLKILTYFEKDCL
jgi:N-acetyltransferase